MVLRRPLHLLTFVLITLVYLYDPASAQEAKPLLVGGEALEAVYPGNFGVSYTEARPFAQALGLSYWQDDASLILGLGSLRVRLPISAIPRSASTLKKLVTSTPPNALRDGQRILVPVRYLSKTLGLVYSGSQSSIRVFLPEAKLRSMRHSVVGGIDVVTLRFDRNVNLKNLGPGHWLLMGVRAEEGAHFVTGVYLNDIRLSPDEYGVELFLDGVAGWPEQVAYFPREARIYVGDVGQKPPPPPLIVIDPGHGGADLGATYGNIYEKDIALKIAREMATTLRQHGYQVKLTRSRDRQTSIYERAQLAAKANVFISLHVAGSPVSPSGPSIYYYTGTKESMPVFAARSRTLLARGGYKQVLSRYAASPAKIEQLSRAIEGEFGKIGLSVRSGQTPLYLLERAPGAAVLLELGSIQNKTDRARLSSSSQQSAYAQALVKAIENYLGGRSP